MHTTPTMPQMPTMPTQESCGCSGSHPEPGATAYGFSPASPLNGSLPFGTPTQTSVPPASGDNQFVKGALIGVGLALLLSNDRVQKSLIKGATTVFNAAQAGVEELKEKFEDMQAEMKERTDK
ncbi:YtxH domain-containing protein [uncultured Desulfuromonas sp.]|uniref:YtxH domain-containing protein n=1 Tax=uncultured Desulfuromonas sp. TaxID=181013 RepID=UPI002AAAE548|nr:YtxH domain-containing protein [uncultured Desulfuromonas sp.]